jgi:dipeptidyl aminopeptidase/acylaminoacyl peptidase
LQPWIWTGGSYSGALAAWIAKLSPGTFWAYHSSSAPVEAIYDYWGYFLPIQNGMPKNCSADFIRIFDHIDNVLASANNSEIFVLKEKFGLEQLPHDDDFAS